MKTSRRTWNEVHPHDIVLYEGKRYGVVQVHYNIDDGVRLYVLPWLTYHSYLKTHRIPQRSVDDGTYRTEGEVDRSVRHGLKFKKIRPEFVEVLP